MNLDCLVLSRDPKVVSVLRPAMEKLSIKLKLSPDGHSGHQLLISEKYDGVVVDCDDLQDGLNILQGVRKAASNQNSVAFAIVNGATTASRAFELGANFVLQKPVEAINAVRCLSAALGLMIRERRRYFRVPVEMSVTLFFGKNEQIKTSATNLSEGGMAIQLKGRPFRNSISKVQFTLLGTNNSIETRAGLAWADGNGRAGIKFLEVPQMCREHLERWLSSHIDALAQS
jgi:DNA-binding response OmpR family regulator